MMGEQNQTARVLRGNGVPILGQPHQIPLVAVGMISQQVLDALKDVMREVVREELRAIQGVGGD